MNIILTPEQEATVHQLAQTTGRTEQELLSEALDRFLREAIETARYHAAIDAFANTGIGDRLAATSAEIRAELQECHHKLWGQD